MASIDSSSSLLILSWASEIYYPRVFRRKKGDYVLPFAVHPSVRLSVRPSGNSLPASPPTLLMLESPNLHA